MAPQFAAPVHNTTVVLRPASVLRENAMALEVARALLSGPSRMFRRNWHLGRLPMLGIAGGIAAALGLGAEIAFLWTAPIAQAPRAAEGAGSVQVRPEAPGWGRLRVGEAKKVESRESDAFAARVKVDETLVSRVGTPVSGRVTAVHVEVGQEVRAGDALFSITSLDIAALRAEHERALIDMGAATASLERVRSMVEAGALPAKEQLRAEKERDTAVVTLRLARSKLTSLRVAPGKAAELTLHAPRDGVLIEKHALPAQAVSAGDTLGRVADLSRVWVVAEVLETDAAEITVGTVARVTSPSLPGFETWAKVSAVSAVVHPLRHTFSVRVELPNQARVLRPNLFAEMRFRWQSGEGTVEIPTGALRSDGARQYVYVESPEGTFTRREVIAGAAHGGTVPVFSGLWAGARVVVEGAVLLDNRVELSR